jgi:hypothetical protein
MYCDRRREGQVRCSAALRLHLIMTRLADDARPPPLLCMLISRFQTVTNPSPISSPFA